MTLLDLLRAAFDKLDRSYAFFKSNGKWLGAGVAVLVLLCLLRYLYRRVRGGSALEKVIKFLLSSSARHIDSALALRASQPLTAYEHAIYGSVMASTAKDLLDDKSAFSKDLDVDVYEYLDYTNKVVSELKKSLSR